MIPDPRLLPLAGLGLLALAKSRDGSRARISPLFGMSAPDWSKGGRLVASRVMPAGVSGVAFVPDSRYLVVTTDEGGGIRPMLSVLGLGREADPLALAQDLDVSRLAVSLDGRWACVLDVIGVATLVSFAVAGGRMQILDATLKATAVAFTADSKHVVVGYGNGEVVFYGVGSGLRAKRISVDGAVKEIVFSPDGKWLFVGADDPNMTNRVYMFETSDPSDQFTYDESAFPVGRMAVSQDSSKLVVCYGKSLYVIDIISDSPRPDHYMNTSQSPLSVACAPGGEVFVFGGEDGVAHFVRDGVRARGLEVVRSFRCDDAVTSVAFSQDGRKLAIGSRDRIVRVFEANP